MNNARRRRELLILTGMLGMCVESARQYPELVKFGPYAYLPELQKQFERACPSAAEQRKEMREARVVVNLLVPHGFEKLDGKLGMLYVSKVCKALIGAGWRMPSEHVAAMFVQNLYSLADQLTLSKALPDLMEQHLTMVVPIVRSRNLFGLKTPVAS